MKQEDVEIIGAILVEYGWYISHNKSDKKPDVIFIKRFDTNEPKEYFEFRVGMNKKMKITPLGEGSNTMVYTSEPYNEHEYFKEFNYNDEYLLCDNFLSILKELDRMMNHTKSKNNKLKHK